MRIQKNAKLFTMCEALAQSYRWGTFYKDDIQHSKL